MHKYTLIFFLISISFSTIAQDQSDDFGKVGIKDFEFTSYDKDPNAEAVILFDIGESVFIDTDKGYDIQFTRTKRIKIFDRSGIDYSEIEIPFYADGYGKTENIISIEAYTYNEEDGRIVKKELDKNSIFEKKVNERWETKSFAFPDVKEGSIIEYRYVLQTPFHFNLPDWEFQDIIPTIYSQYSVSMIPFYEYSYIAQGIKKFDAYKSVTSSQKRTLGNVSKVYGMNYGSGVEFQDLTHTFVMKDVPAFKDESYITSPKDYIMKIDFQLSRFNSPTGSSKEIITTWPKFNEELLDAKEFGKYIKGCDKISKKIIETELSLSNKSDLEKSKIIIDYVKYGFNWNGYYSKYASKTPKDFYLQKTGNSADINLFLCSILSTANIKSSPILISTRDHGKINANYPFAHFLNNVIVLVNTEHPFITDATDNMIAYNQIPANCINEKGLIVDENDAKWISLENQPLSQEIVQINLKPNPDDQLASTLNYIQTTNFEAYRLRKSYNGDSTKFKDYLIAKGFESIDNLKPFNYSDGSKPFLITFEAKNEIEKLGKNLIINPFLNYPIKENKLKQKNRSYPVDLIYAFSKTIKSTITIPDGYSVKSIPENFALDNELATIKVSYKRFSGFIEAYGTYVFKKPIYQPNEYARIKYYFNTVVKKFNESIILEEIDLD